MNLESGWIPWPGYLGDPPPVLGVQTIQGRIHVHRTALLDLAPGPRAILERGPRLWSLERVAPPPNPDLRPYQLEGVDFASRRDGSVLAFSMGLGKTRTALAAVGAPRRVGVVVAPRVAFPVWLKEIPLVLGDIPIHRVCGRAQEPPGTLHHPGIYLVNPEILFYRCAEWSDIVVDWAVFDEAHLYANGRTLRSRGATNLAAFALHRVALSGTPILRHPTDLHGVLSTVVPRAFGSWTRFALALGMERTAHGWILDDLAPDRKRWLDDRLSDVMLTRRWTDVGLEVPRITREKIGVDLDERAATRYRALAADLRLHVPDVLPLSKLAGIARLKQTGSLQRQVGRAKVAAAVELVAGLGEPAVVWVWFHEQAHAITDALSARGLRVGLITGEHSATVRDRIVASFQAGDLDILVSTYGVGGVGIDLSRARVSVFAELSGDWTPSTMAQAEARVFRSTQRNACLTYWLYAEGTIEARMVEVLLRKAAHANVDIFPEGGLLAGDEESWDPDIGLGTILASAGLGVS
ncbi:MAG: DEAD/DEAH box helicase [Candidatus Bipolaricaulota bacterium]